MLKGILAVAIGLHGAATTASLVKKWRRPDNTSKDKKELAALAAINVAGTVGEIAVACSGLGLAAKLAGCFGVELARSGALLGTAKFMRPELTCIQNLFRVGLVNKAAVGKLVHETARRLWDVFEVVDQAFFKPTA